MQAGPSQHPLPFAYGDAKVTTPRGDLVTVPFFRAPTDGAWMVPFMLFWQIALQEGVVSRHAWSVEARVYSSRDATPQEIQHLQSMLFLPSHATSDWMVPIDGLAGALEELSLRVHAVEATLKSIEGIKANSSTSGVAHASARGGLAQVLPCTLSRSQLKETYSLKAEFVEYFEDGTPFMAQYNATEEFFCNNPPVGSGIKRSWTLNSLSIKLDSAQEFFGYCRKFEGREPSFELLRDTTLLAKFVSFRIARGNSVNTILMELLNLEALVPFAFFPGACPDIPSVPEAEWDATIKWFKSVVPKYRAESKQPQHKRAMTGKPHLHQVWEHSESNWAELKADYQVSHNLATIPH